MAFYTEFKNYLINDCYKWVVPDRYVNLIPLGQGSFGLVWYKIKLLSKAKLT